jgi:hypothetical protein
MGCASSRVVDAPPPPPAAAKAKPKPKRKPLLGRKVFDIKRDPRRYSVPISLYSELHTREDSPTLPPVRLLKSSWLIERGRALAACSTRDARMALALPRRQDLERLHPEAFYTAQEVARLETRKHLGVTQLSVVSVSHTWKTPNHPDPEGQTLSSLVEVILDAQTIVDGAHDALPSEFAVFFDWCSLCQKGTSGEPRSADEETSFRAALGRMQLWYAFQGTCTICMTQKRKNAGLPYHRRGWPTFEYRLSMLAKPGSSKKRWPTVLDAADGRAGNARRLAPLTPERMAAELATRKFTNGADRDFVAELYKDTSEAVIAGAQALSYHKAGWGDDDLSVFVEWVPRMTSLRRLALGANHISDRGLRELVEASAVEGALPRLAFLRLHDNDEITEAGTDALAAALKHGAMPELRVISIPRVGAALVAVCKQRGIKLTRYLGAGGDADPQGAEREVKQASAAEVVDEDERND